MAIADAEILWPHKYEVGLLNGILFAVASVAMILWGRHLDRRRERFGTLRCRWAFRPRARYRVRRDDGDAFHPNSVPHPRRTYALKGPFFALSSEWLADTARRRPREINALGNLAGFVTVF